MSIQNIHEQIGALFVAAGLADDGVEATVRNAYEYLLGYDPDNMEAADARIGYWTDRLGDDLSSDDFVATFLHQAETDSGTHVEEDDFAANILAVRSVRSDVEEDPDDLPTAPGAAADRVDDLGSASADARAAALDLNDEERAQVLQLQPDDPLPDELTDEDEDEDEDDTEEVTTLTLEEAIAAADDDDLPDAYELSDGELDMGESGVTAAEDALAQAQSIIDDADNSDDIDLDAAYSLRDGPAGFDGRSGQDALFADAAAVVLEGGELELDNFAFDAAGSGDGSRRVEVDNFDQDLIIELGELTGFDHFTLGGSAGFDPDNPGIADLFLPDGAGLEVEAESQAHVVLGAGGQRFVSSDESDRIVAGSDSATDEADLSAGGNNVLAFNPDLPGQTVLQYQVMNQDAIDADAPPLLGVVFDRLEFELDGNSYDLTDVNGQNLLGEQGDDTGEVLQTYSDLEFAVAAAVQDLRTTFPNRDELDALEVQLGGPFADSDGREGVALELSAGDDAQLGFATINPNNSVFLGLAENEPTHEGAPISGANRSDRAEANDVPAQQFSVEGFDVGFNGDILDFQPIADGPGLNNTDESNNTDILLQVVGTGGIVDSETTIVAFADGEAADAASIADEFTKPADNTDSASEFSASMDFGTGPVPVPRNGNFEEDSQLLFLIADGDGNTNVWYWDDAAGNGEVGASELGLLATLEGVDDPGEFQNDNIAGLPTLLSATVATPPPEEEGGL